jgi:septum formation protein
MKIILASTSPRRHQLLKDIGFDFEIIKPTSEEIEIKGESPKRMVARLAEEKAQNVFEQRSSDSSSNSSSKPYLIIAADTTVVSPDGRQVLGKPSDPSHALKMLKKISGRGHRVFTSYTIFLIETGKIKKKYTRTVQTIVEMRKLSTQQIKNYVATGEPMDKAGAYGAQGVGMCLIEAIRGSYTNVVGLPMSELASDLKSKFKISPSWDK